MKWVNTPFRDGQREISINLLILIGDLDCFGVVLVKVSNVASVSRVDFALWWDERWRVVLLIDLLPVDPVKEGMVFDLKNNFE